MTKTKKAKTKGATKGAPSPNMAKALLVQPMPLQTISLHIVGTSPMIQHAWSEKGLTMMRMTAAERRKVPKVARDPQAEGMGGAYRTDDGEWGVPAMALKSAIVSAAHKDIGLAKTAVQKAIMFPSAGVIPMTCSEPIIREDIVRVGMGSTDLRYRPEFHEWRVEISFTFDSDVLTAQDIVNLVDRAGFGVGLGEWRPEKGGEHGRFRVDTEAGIEIDNA